MNIRNKIFILLLLISNNSFAVSISGSSSTSHPDYNGGKTVVMEFKRVVTDSDGALMAEAEGQSLVSKDLLVTSGSIITISNKMLKLRANSSSSQFHITQSTMFCGNQQSNIISDFKNGEIATIVTKRNNSIALSVRKGGMLFGLGQYSGATAKNYDCRDLAKSRARSNLIIKSQKLLNGANYDAGSADGIAGTRTIKAVKQFQKDHGLPITGDISEDLINQLNAISGKQ